MSTERPTSPTELGFLEAGKRLPTPIRWGKCVGLWMVAVVDGRVVGAVAAMHRQVALDGADLEAERGWITFVVVDPAHRRQGIGAALLSNAFDWLRAQGATEVHFSPYTPNYVLPGLDAAAYPEGLRLLERAGFTTRYEAVAMDRSLADYAMPVAVKDRVAALEGDGYRFGTPADDELPSLIRLAREAFTADWARAIREGISAGLPTEQIVVAREPGGALVGWAMFGTYENVRERFGPFGVLPECRGTGLGKVLLHLTMERMRAAGARSAWFLWTGAESPAGHLYRATGLSTTRTFRVMEARLVSHDVTE